MVNTANKTTVTAILGLQLHIWKKINQPPKSSAEAIGVVNTLMSNATEQNPLVIKFFIVVFLMLEELNSRRIRL
jgi:hypothetical protein